MANKRPLINSSGVQSELTSSDALELPAGLIVDTTTLVVDSTNNRVGIGTASPAVALDVVGRARASTGILFGTDTADANALDDYEEGTWTPALVNIGTGTYSVQGGSYTKIGRLVVALLHLGVLTVGTASGDLIVSGLPFANTSNSFSYSTASMIHATDWSTARSDLNVLLNPSATTINIFYGSAITTAATTVTHADIGTGNLLFTITYEVA